MELTGIINKPLLFHLVGCLYYLYQWCTVKQISDYEIYLLIKYIKSVLWRVAKRLSYTEEARCLKVNVTAGKAAGWTVLYSCPAWSKRYYSMLWGQIKSSRTDGTGGTWKVPRFGMRGATSILSCALLASYSLPSSARVEGHVWTWVGLAGGWTEHL